MNARGTLLALLLTSAVGALAVPASGSAQALYRWTDEQGQTHITDDPNQVPERYRPKPPAPDPRTAAAGAIAALKSLGALVGGEPLHEEYMRQVGEAREAVDRALTGLDGGPLRAALTSAMRCYGEAAELWDNQLKVRRGFDLPLNLMPIQGAWACGAEKTGEAERLFAAAPPR